LKNKQVTRYLFSLITLVIATLLMQYLRPVYFVGMIILFIIVVFQTPTPKVDKTGEANDANIAILKVVAMHTIMYLAGGYLALLIF